MELTPILAKPVWLDRFINRIGALVPSLDLASATAHAEATFEDAADLDPDEAAAIVALELPPVDAGASGG